MSKEEIIEAVKAMTVVELADLVKAIIASPLRFFPFSRKLKSGENKG